MPNRPPPIVVTVWVPRECVIWDRGPYDWTAECVEGRALVHLAEADAMPTLRPCRLCASRSRRQVGAR